LFFVLCAKIIYLAKYLYYLFCHWKILRFLIRIFVVINILSVLRWIFHTYFVFFRRTHVILPKCPGIRPNKLRIRGDVAVFLRAVFSDLRAASLPDEYVCVRHKDGRFRAHTEMLRAVPERRIERRHGHYDTKLFCGVHELHHAKRDTHVKPYPHSAGRDGISVCHTLADRGASAVFGAGVRVGERQIWQANAKLRGQAAGILRQLHQLDLRDTVRAWQYPYAGGGAQNKKRFREKKQKFV